MYVARRKWNDTLVAECWMERWPPVLSLGFRRLYALGRFELYVGRVKMSWSFWPPYLFLTIRIRLGQCLVPDCRAAGLQIGFTEEAGFGYVCDKHDTPRDGR